MDAGSIPAASTKEIKPSFKHQSWLRVFLFKRRTNRGSIVRCAWLTDIHLEFLSSPEAEDFIKSLTQENLDAIFLTGDISTARRLNSHLNLFNHFFHKSVYFVLGNHDYYGGSIDTVRQHTAQFCQEPNQLHWLPTSGVVELTSTTCLVGHDSWADGRFGDFRSSPIMLNDYVQIKDFIPCNKTGRLALLNHLGDEAADFFRTLLPVALAKYEHVIVLTHAPPFKEACWHEGAISSDEWLPHFSCQAVGEVLKEAMIKNPNRKMTVLCGHTHGCGIAEILPNLLVKTGGAEYGCPKIQEIIEI
jgi:predicted MPP superfamily phosphohydrolase